MTFGFRNNAVALGILVGIATATVGCGDEVEPVVIEDEDGHRIFITTGPYAGNLASTANEDTGVENADYICNVQADSDDLEGDWKAWISTQETAAVDRLEERGPWFLVDEEQRGADDLEQLIADGPQTAIDMTSSGAVIDSNRTVWTGTQSNGEHGGDNCADWSSESDLTFGVYGYISDSDDNSDWTDAGTNPCNQTHRLYCFEQ